MKKFLFLGIMLSLLAAGCGSSAPPTAVKPSGLNKKIMTNNDIITITGEYIFDAGNNAPTTASAWERLRFININPATYSTIFITNTAQAKRILQAQSGTATVELSGLQAYNDGSAAAIVDKVISNKPDNGQSQNNPESMDNYLGMQADSGEYKDFANKVVAEMAKGNSQFLKDNFSPNGVAANAPGALDSALLPAVQTFFTNFDHVGSSVTIQPSTDSFGSSGYSFAMPAVYKDGSEKPFKVYVVKEGGKLVVGNFIVTK